MDIEYDVTLDDMVEFNIYCVLHHPQNRGEREKTRKNYLVSTVVCFLVGLISAFSVNQFYLGLYFGELFLLFGVISAISYFQFSDSQTRKRIKKVVIKQYLKIPNDEICRHKLSISEAGLREVTDYNDSTFYWAAFSEIVQTDNYLYFFLKPGKAHMVPKRAFVDEATLNRFTETARMFHAKALH